jgi:hypothetical protein
MKLKISFCSVAAVAFLAAGSGLLTAPVAHAAGCEAGDRIDGSTADTARKKMETAGYRQVRDLKKGCDNSWHGTAVKDGAESRVLLTPQGQVLRDGN